MFRCQELLLFYKNVALYFQRKQAGLDVSVQLIATQPEQTEIVKERAALYLIRPLFAPTFAPKGISKGAS